jgi:hypothetical protein
MSNPWITHLKKVRQENPSLSYKECMIKGKQSYKKKQKGGSVIGDQAGHVWKLLKKVGKATAVASLAIPAAVLTSQVAFAAFLKAQPDNGVAFLEKSAKWLVEEQ